MLFFLLSDVEKKRKHKLNKHRSPPIIIPVEGALRMLQTHATPRTMPFVLIQLISSCARSIPPMMILLPPSLYPPFVNNVGESALSL